MREDITIRPSGAEDIAALEHLVHAAFPGEDLLPLLRSLLGAMPCVLSLVAASAGDPIGHAVFTRGTVAGEARRVALLGPLAVAQARRGQGIARALVEHGARLLAGEGVARLVVLGDPAFYGRLGFVPERGVVPPFSLPPAWAEAWQGMALGPGGMAPRGTLVLPEAWNRASLWAP